MEDVLKLQWLAFNAALQQLNEQELQRMLHREINGKRRLSYVLRLRGRLNKVQYRRSMQEVLTSMTEGEV